ncbi:MAG: putative 7-carboxy-7-deazaguanine synthase QueE [Lachnospiraceae bacterium]|nr:putative 7-carboxy-7-deazaguanine synthase QueE [Lachnospiraceae bacterium]
MPENSIEIFEIVEIFESINGEGLKAGELSAFVRMKGCNLDCSFCDTAWAKEKDAEATYMTTSEILEEIASFGVKNVTLTGGEPMEKKGIFSLIMALVDHGYQVEVETNGSIDLREYALLSDIVSFTIDYKLPGSGMEEKMLLENFLCFGEKNVIKFVVTDRTDLERAYALCEDELRETRCRIYLSPAFGKIEPEEIVEFMKEKKWTEARLQLQLHKIIWEPDARGV